MLAPTRAMNEWIKKRQAGRYALPPNSSETFSRFPANLTS